MAETALYLALRKIALAVERGNHFLDGSRLRRIESELRMIHCFLGQMETRYTNNQVLVSWVAEARKLGCLAEETVDRCIYKQSHQGSTLNTIVNRLILLLLNESRSRRSMFTQLSELESELEHLSKMKKRWVQVDNGDPYVPAHDTASLSYQQQQRVYHFISEEPVGFDGQIMQLTARLQNNGVQADEENKSVAAVWGPGGSGKTTLVRFVYERQRRHFDCAAWISMSGCSSAAALLIKVRRQLLLEGDTAITSEDSVERSVDSLSRGGLKEKKFLIVFDDVEATDGIFKVRDLLQRRSRIIIITGIKEVATEVDQLSMKIEGLNDDEALKLFRSVSLVETPELPAGLKEIYEQDIPSFDLCKGLPQVIISIGAASSRKQKQALEQIRKQLSWVHHISLNDRHKCLYVSYNNLPMHLKTCLLYCGIFPAGYLLLCDKLVRYLVAEGFIENQRASEMEEIADGYLMELIRWGFLQRVDGDGLGRVASCRMPIIVHDLVRAICKKEGFGIACDGVELPETGTDVRCLFISRDPQHIDSLADFPHLRTIIVGDTSAAESSHPRKRMRSKRAALPVDAVRLLASVFMPFLALFTVLELHGSLLTRLPYAIEDLFNLRYLGLRNTNYQSLPSFIRSLRNMQTLDLKSSCITKLPDWIGKLARLRHLLADGPNNESDQTKIPRGVNAPRSVKYLKQLQTLERVEASASLVKSLDMLTMLRSLCISSVESKSCKALFASVSKLPSLSSLSISARDVNQVLKFDSLNPKELKSLGLGFCKLEENSLQSLSANLRNLLSLNLHNVSGISSIKFQEDSFTELRKLVLRDIIQVKDIDIPQGALGKLEVLHIESLINLNKVQDLKKFQSIKDLYFGS